MIKIYKIAIIGLGYSNYQFVDSSISRSQQIINPYETSGVAFMYGLFLDWGGDDFGFRIGTDSVRTILDPLVINSKSYQEDGSYEGVYYGIRSAW